MEPAIHWFVYPEPEVLIQGLCRENRKHRIYKMPMMNFNFEMLTGLLRTSLGVMLMKTRT